MAWYQMWSLIGSKLSWNPCDICAHIIKYPSDVIQKFTCIFTEFQDNFDPINDHIWYRAMNAVPQITCSSYSNALEFSKNAGKFLYHIRGIFYSVSTNVTCRSIYLKYRHDFGLSYSGSKADYSYWLHGAPCKILCGALNEIQPLIYTRWNNGLKL